MNTIHPITIVNGEPTVNGVTSSRLAAMMRNLEKQINWYNKKYNFDVPTTEKSFQEIVSRWDFFRFNLDRIKTYKS